MRPEPVELGDLGRAQGSTLGRCPTEKQQLMMFKCTTQIKTRWNGWETREGVNEQMEREVYNSHRTLLRAQEMWRRRTFFLWSSIPDFSFAVERFGSFFRGLWCCSVFLPFKRRFSLPLLLVVGQALGFCKDIYRHHVHLSPFTWRHFDCDDTILTYAFLQYCRI